MMKRFYGVFTLACFFAVSAFGCGKTKDEAAAGQENEASVIQMDGENKTAGIQTDEEIESGSYRQISSPFRMKQAAMFGGDCGWGLSDGNEVFFTESGTENFTSVKKVTGVTASSDGFVSADFCDARRAYVVYFPENDDGTGAEGVAVEYTADSGQNWKQTVIKFADYGVDLDAGSAYISFANESRGYLLCCSTPAMGQMEKILFGTEDGGETFSVVGDLTDAVTGYPQGISFIDAETGYLAVTYHGEDNYLYKTTDNGKTWNSEKLAVESDGKVSYVDGYTPVFFGTGRQDGALILKVVGDEEKYALFTTADGGESWKQEKNLAVDSVRSYSADSRTQRLVVDEAGNMYQF